MLNVLENNLYIENKILNLKKDLRFFSSIQKKKVLQRFFKTKKGEYGEGDVFLGIVVPNIRKVAKKYKNLKFSEIKKILYSKIHEERLCALFILVDKFENRNDIEKYKIFKFYIKNVKQINNWDLVDLSAPKIVGKYLLDKPKDLLYKFAVSRNLWERRISIISTYTFIKNGQFEDTFKIAEILMGDKHDLIRKSVGWMLREVGKKSLKDEEKFLKKYSKVMPRTMLRYAIEKFPEEKRLKYLKGL